jgi:peptide subunit release factor 1 (eRF1)
MSNANIDRQLTRLTGLKPAGHPIVSLYLKLEPRDRTRGKYLIKLKNRIKAARDGLPALGFSVAEQRIAEKDLDRIFRDLERPGGLPPTQGIAIFASSGRDLYERIPLPFVHRSRLVVDRTPLVGELLAVGDEVGRLLTAVLDRTSARIFEVTAFGTREVADLRAEATRGGRFHSDRRGAPGVGEHTYHNRIRNEKQRHLDAVADRLFTLDREAPVRGLVVAGIGTDATALTPFLHPYLKGRVLGSVRLNPRETSAASVHAATLETRRRAGHAAAEELVHQVEEAAGTGWAVLGVRDTLSALARGQIRTMVVSPDAEVPGFRCASGRLALSEKECRGEGGCIPVPDIVDDAIEDALRQRVAVEVVQAPAAARIDGLAGLLRFR